MSAQRLIDANQTGSAKTPILEARALSRNSPTDGKPLLRKISLRLDLGARTVLQGSSGSGKSVLLRALAALDDSEGELLWNGRALTPSEIPAFRADVCYLHQSSVFPEGTVKEALNEPYGWSVHKHKTFDQAFVAAHLSALGYEATFLDKLTTDLSGGESQVLAALRAIQLSPTLLLLDEPTAALDPRTSNRFEAMMLDWVSQPEKGFLWVTHDQAQAERMGTHVLHIAEGVLRG